MNSVTTSHHRFLLLLKSSLLKYTVLNVSFLTMECLVFVYQTPSFWVMLRGVKQFVHSEGNGNLPVRGTIPDMMADSQKFINLQNV